MLVFRRNVHVEVKDGVSALNMGPPESENIYCRECVND